MPFAGDFQQHILHLAFVTYAFKEVFVLSLCALCRQSRPSARGKRVSYNPEQRVLLQ